MKRLVLCLSLFLGTGTICLAIGFLMTRYGPEPIPEPMATTIQAQAPSQTAEAANQKEVEHVSTVEQPPYCLVVEDGFLLVFRRDQDKVCLYTHIPITDFPMEEQEKLREGIWFSTMMEVYSYLESYTS